MSSESVDLILRNGKITTLVSGKSEVSAVAISAGKIAKIGSDDEIMQMAELSTKIIDLNVIFQYLS